MTEEGTLRALGLMSGTSMDGIDVALVETDGRAVVRTGPTLAVPYADLDRDLLRQALRDALTIARREERPGVLAAAEAMVTRRHAEAVQDFLARQGIGAGSLDVIGFHGQTVLHRLERGLTVQIGDGAALAAMTGVAVVDDMRAIDVAAGGQGAPLVPVFHQALLQEGGIPLPCAVLNLGGVGNVTLLQADADPLAFDTGPGNALLDDLVVQRTNRTMDVGGEIARAGTVDNAALATLVGHPFFRQRPPKSLDRNAFSSSAVASLSTADAAATLAAFTAESAAQARRWLPCEPSIWIVCGGGARNPALVQGLAARVPGRVVTADAVGWSAEFLEAQAFAYLAVRSLKGLPLTFPGTTGVSRPLTGGRLVQPASVAR